MWLHLFPMTGKRAGVGRGSMVEPLGPLLSLGEESRRGLTTRIKEKGKLRDRIAC